MVLMSASKAARHQSSMVSQTTHYGEMGGLAPTTNIPVGVKLYRLRRARNKQTIPTAPISGLEFMKLHDMLSKNPAGSGGIGHTKVLVNRAMGPCICSK
jgi:hypothetical protein